jgi:hypothetical protein
VGGINSETSGYHETLTFFWLWALEQYCVIQGKITFDQTTLDDMLWTEELADRNLWLNYYSKDYMMSVRARMEFLDGDLKSLFH